MADQLFWCRFQVEFLACTAGVSTVVFPIFAELAAELSSSVLHISLRGLQQR